MTPTSPPPPLDLEEGKRLLAEVKAASDEFQATYGEGRPEAWRRFSAKVGQWSLWLDRNVPALFSRLEASEAALAEERRRGEALREDADRYRYLRQPKKARTLAAPVHGYVWVTDGTDEDEEGEPFVTCLSGEACDAAVDRERAALSPAAEGTEAEE